MKILLFAVLSVLCIAATGQRAEQFRNGGIDNSDHWTILHEGDWVISDGVAHFEDINRGYLRQSASDMVTTIQDNATYILTFDIIPDTTGGVARMRIYGDRHSPLYKPYDNYSEGTNQVVFTTPATGNPGGIEFYASTDEDGFSIDNVSLVQGADPVGSPYFVSLTGHDGNNGSISSPFATPERAFMLAGPGDSIYVRAGIYYRTQNQGSMSVSVADGTCNQGEPDNVIFFGGYPPDIANGDSVIFDFSLISPEEPDYAGIEADPPTATTRTNNGFSFSWLNYFHLSDFTIRNLWQKYRYVQVRGMNFFACNYFTLERVNVRTIGGQGIFSANGTIDPTKYKSGTDTLIADPPLDPYTITNSTVWMPGDTTYVINCDGYHCIDSFAVNVGNYEAGQAGSWAQAFFFVNSFAGEFTEFRNCRAWRCGDDGFNNHGYGTTWLNNCWSFNNGFYLEYLDYMTPGNGYKVNNVSTASRVDRDQIHHWVTNSIAAFNIGYGFNENHRGGQPTLNRNNYNNLAYKNWIGFITSHDDLVGWEHLDNRYINNLAHDHRTANSMQTNGNYFETEITNSWNTPPGVTVTDADFLALPTDPAHNLAILGAPRQADGSLPDIGDYYKLAPTSNLIDAGTDVGLPYNGSAPDLGPFEFGTISVEIVSPKNDRKINKGDDVLLKARAYDTDGPVEEVFFTIEGQDEPIGMAEKKTSDEWGFYWKNTSEIGNYALRAIAINNNGDKATSQRINITIDNNDDGSSEKESCCHLVYDKDSINPKLIFMEPLTENPNLTFLTTEGVIIHAETYYIKDISNEIEIDLSIFDPGIHLIVVPNVKCCLPEKIMKF